MTIRISHVRRDNLKKPTAIYLYWFARWQHGRCKEIIIMLVTHNMVRELFDKIFAMLRRYYHYNVPISTYGLIM